MKTVTLRIKWAFLCLLMIGRYPGMAQEKSFADYVNPFIGTEKSSHKTVWESRGATFPGALAPFGMVQIAPSGYMYSDSSIRSFSFLNHHSGWSSSGSFDLMIGSGVGNPHPSAFDHAREKASPYAYRVYLNDYRITAEFTATAHAALCRFIMDSNDSVSLSLSGVSSVSAVNRQRIEGRSGPYFFVAEFDKAFDYPSESAGRPGLFFLRFAAPQENKILVRFGFSLTSLPAAGANLASEIPGWHFEEVSEQLKNIWNDRLGKIEIRTTDEQQKEIFYTALYHSMFMPSLISDAGAQRDAYTGLYPWDTYRSEHPLITILDPSREGDMISSELARYDKTGWLPTGNMMGNHNTEVMLNALVNGVKNFDSVKAAEAIAKSLLDSPYARREMAAFVRYGYVPAEITSSVTHSLEFAYDDWAGAEFLARTGISRQRAADYKILLTRAGNYRNSYDPEAGFMRAKTTDGRWTGGGYSEGTAWTYSWYVPQDVQGLINLMGGRQSFTAKLDKCFENGHYVHDNEPPLHYAYLFNFCGEPWKTQRWVRNISTGSYSTDPGGIPGNDDLGAMSSWYVLSALGFYPVTPGTGQYEIGSPLFGESTIHLPNGKNFCIRAEGASPANKYIQSATLNGMPFNRSWFTHADIVNGSTLVFKMGAQPNKSWAVQPDLLPYSMTKGSPRFTALSLSSDQRVLKANEDFSLFLEIRNTTTVAGTGRFQLNLDGKPFKTISAMLSGAEQKRVPIALRLYEQGLHQLDVAGLPPIKFRIEKTEPVFEYRDLVMPAPALVTRGDSLEIGATIKNTGSYAATVSVPFLINDSTVQTRRVLFRAGEERKIMFSYPTAKAGVYRIGIGKLDPELLRIQDAGEKPPLNRALLKSLGARLVLDFDEGDENLIRDQSGAHNDALANGRLTWVKGIYGRAVKTNAARGEFISLPDPDALNQLTHDSALTVMAWVYPEDENNFADIISKGEWVGLQVKGSNRIIDFYANGWEGHEAMAPVPENWNRHWHHLAGVSDGKTYRLYVDGKLVETKPSEKRNPKGETGLSDYSGAPWNIGRNAASPDRVFRGPIDDVMIFNQVLSQPQVVALMLRTNGNN